MKKSTLLAISITALLFSCKDNEPDPPAKPYNYRDDIVGTYRGELKTVNYTTEEVTITNPVIFVEAVPSDSIVFNTVGDSCIKITGDIDPNRQFFSYILSKNYTFGLGYFSQPDSLTFRTINSLYAMGYFYMLKKQ